MAQKLSSDEERDRRVDFVGRLFLKSGASTRRLAKAISTSEHGFKISNATVADYINRYKNDHPEKADQIDSLIDANKGSLLKDENVVNRVKTVVGLIKNGYFIEEIARLLNKSYWVVYYDLHIRFKQMDNKEYLMVKDILEHNARNHDGSKKSI